MKRPVYTSICCVTKKGITRLLNSCCNDLTERQASSRSAGKEVLRPLWNTEVLYLVHNIQPLVYPKPRKFIPQVTTLLLIVYVHFNTTLLPTPVFTSD